MVNLASWEDSEMERVQKEFDVTGFLELLGDTLQEQSPDCEALAGVLTARIHVRDGEAWAVSVRFDNADPERAISRQAENLLDSSARCRGDQRPGHARRSSETGPEESEESAQRPVDARACGSGSIVRSALARKGASAG
jgi:hypothetical protein